MPVLGREAGFAARFQAFGWPAFAPDGAAEPNAGTPEALYLSFANHIVYERGSARGLSFDGPPARHLVPNIARRRAPDRNAANAALSAIALPVSGTERDDKTAARAAPILPPAVERATVGRRPGVLEASVASLTLPADVALFDPAYPRFGRPANSGPVAAHQLRNPRSPVLPTDDIPGDPESAERLTLALRRRTYLSIADLDTDTGQLPLFGAYEGSADVVRFEQREKHGRRHDRATFFIKEDPRIGPDWPGSLSLVIDLRSLSLGNAMPAPRVDASGRLEVGDVSFPLLLAIKTETATSPQAAMLLFEFTDGLIINASVARPREVQAQLRDTTADTPVRVVLELMKSAYDSVARLPAGPRALVVLPLTLDPGMRRVIPVRTTTVAFADPSYDRQLASQAAGATENMDGSGEPFLLSADRRKYDPGSSIYFAGGRITQPDGTFDTGDTSDYLLFIRRLPPRLANGDQPPPELLVCAGLEPDGEDGSYKMPPAKVFELAIRKLVRPDLLGSDKAAGALSPGDRLELTARPDPDDSKREVRVVVDVVAEPVIAPPPSVYSVIETTKDKSSARVPLHAAAPLPQKIEFPDLLRDLALQHVRRRALFVWQYAKAGHPSSSLDPPLLDLLKFDRSGGAQLPPEGFGGRI
jgi:hypothetical protein